MEIFIYKTQEFIFLEKNYVLDFYSIKNVSDILGQYIYIIPNDIDMITFKNDWKIYKERQNIKKNNEEIIEISD